MKSKKFKEQFSLLEKKKSVIEVDKTENKYKIEKEAYLKILEIWPKEFDEFKKYLRFPPYLVKEYEANAVLFLPKHYPIRIFLRNNNDSHYLLFKGYKTTEYVSSLSLEEIALIQEKASYALKKEIINLIRFIISKMKKGKE